MRIVVGHKGCPDGQTAMWALWKAFGDQETEYIPAAHGDPLVFKRSVEVADVIFVDFSWAKEAILALGQAARSVAVLDHHESAAMDLAGLFEWGAETPPLTYSRNRGNISVTMDMDRSGAAIAWDWMHVTRQRPRLVEYVQDRDLWRFNLPYSREISQWLRSFPYEMMAWDHAATILEDDGGFAGACVTGGQLLKFQNQQVHIMAEHANWRWIAGYPVPVANASAFFSEVAEKLLERYPTAKMTAYHWDRRDNVRQWGLRSRPGFDVSVVAKAYGGGGHAQAAGWTESSAIPLPPIADGSHDA